MYNPVCMPSDLAIQSNFNLSISESPVSDTGLILWTLSYITFYAILENSIIYLFEKNEADISNTFLERLYLKNQPRPDIINDNSIPDTTKLEILHQINNDLLFRSALLHYIFRIQGDFSYSDISNECDECNGCDACTDMNFINAYDEYIFWRDIYGGEQHFNLDETLPNDITYIIDGVDHGANRAHITFISWVYYSGLYNYLCDPHNYKRVLDSMYRNRELYGRQFLEYHLYCNDYDAKYDDSKRIIYYDDIQDDIQSDSIPSGYDGINQVGAPIPGSDMDTDMDMDTDSENQYTRLLDKLEISNVIEQVEYAVYYIGQRIYNNCTRVLNRLNENIENNLEMFKVR